MFATYRCRMKLLTASLPVMNCLMRGNAYRLPHEFEQLVEQFFKQLLKQLGVGVETFPPCGAQAGPGTRPRTLGQPGGNVSIPIPSCLSNCLMNCSIECSKNLELLTACRKLKLLPQAINTYRCLLQVIILTAYRKG